MSVAGTYDVTVTDAKTCTATGSCSLLRSPARPGYYFDPRLPEVQIDVFKMEQALGNVFKNALQAMPRGGTLRVNLSQADQAVAVAIQDTGIGIPPENLRRIFDPFFTTKPEGEGTGLGLSTSYGIVTHHRGRIDVESSVGAGTTFTILLPTHQSEPES